MVCYQFTCSISFAREAFFSWTEDGTLLLEAANGIELEEDFDNNG